MIRKTTATLLACALAALPLLSCFSERSAITQPNGEGCVVPGGAIGPDRTVVFIRDFGFFPDTIRVTEGTRVTWVNCEEPGTEAHTSTANSDAWDSGTLQPGTSFEHTFTEAGVNGYFCRPHPFMVGAVIVE